MQDNGDKSKTRLSALAQLVALYAECKGVTAAAKLAELTGYSERAIWKARAELRFTEPECTLNHSSVNQSAVHPEPECSATLNQSSAPLARAYKESPSEIVISKGNSPPTPPGRDFWQKALGDQNVNGGVERDQNGRIVLVNGTRAYWLGQFDNDEKRLELALIEAASRLQPGSTIPLKAQVERSLAHVAGQRHDQNKRYQQTRTKPDTPKKLTAGQRRLQRAQMEAANG